MFKWQYFNNTLVKNHKTLVYSLNSNVLYIVIGFWSHLTLQSVVIVQSSFNVLHVWQFTIFILKTLSIIHLTSKHTCAKVKLCMHFQNLNNTFHLGSFESDCITKRGSINFELVNSDIVSQELKKYQKIKYRLCGFHSKFFLIL